MNAIDKGTGLYGSATPALGKILKSASHILNLVIISLSNPIWFGGSMLILISR